jgi:hypothetical protein
MHCTRAIRTDVMFRQHWLALAFQCRIAAAHDRIAQIVDAVIGVPAWTFIDRKIFVADLHGKFVDVNRHAHEAVQFVKDGDAEDIMAGG